MKKRNKILLFFLCLSFFLLATPIVIFYSQGYRFDFDKKKITQTGGIFLKARPKKAEVYVGGQLKKETDFLFGSTLIENLLPGEYKITVQKEGFQKWEKKLSIEEKKVTEAKNILLWPENLSFENLTSGVKKFFLSPDKEKIVLIEVEEQKMGNERETAPDKKSKPAEISQSALSITKTNLKLYDLNRKIKSHLISTDDFRKKDIEILEIHWSPDSQKVLLEITSQEQVKYWLLEIYPQPKLTFLDFLPQDILNLEFAPRNPQKIFLEIVQKPQGKTNFSNFLFEADLREKKINPLPILEDFIYYKVEGETLYRLTQEGFLYKSSLSGEGKEKINQTALLLQKGEVEYKIFVRDGNIFFQEGSTLFWFNEKSRIFEKVLEGVLEIEFSPDNKRVAVMNEEEIWILFLEKEFSQPQKEKGEKLLLARFVEKISKISWLNSHYLLLNNEDKLRAIEIDDRSGPQIWLLSQFKNPEIFFSQNNKRLYLVSEERLLSSEPLF